jgi:hypothetical protein
MENTTNSLEKNTSNQDEEKIVNLFEDMNFHEHNEESYKKMTQKIHEDNSSK